MIHDIICANCSTQFSLTEGQYNKHDSKMRFCGVECSSKYQRKLYAEMRERGKRCSRCGDVKPIGEFAKCAIGKKSPRPNKIYQYCHACKARYRMVFCNRVKMKCIKYLGGRCVKCGVAAGMKPPSAASDII